LYYIIKNKSWKALLYFLSIPFLSFGILFLQGLNISDLINSLLITKTMTTTKTLTYFYQNSGIYFHPKALITNLTLFFKCAIPFIGILFGVLKNKKLIIFISSILFIFLFDTKIGFGFLPIFLLILTIISGFQREKVCNRDFLLTISAFLVSAKVFWVLLLGSYGNYYVSIVLVGIFVLLFKFLPQRLEKYTGVCILVLGILVILSNSLPSKEFFIQTAKGKIFITKSVKSTNDLVDFINKNTKANDKIVMFPEGMVINFLTNRQSDGFYNSMLPLYIETFGEDNFIEHFKLNKPEYIVFNNLNMKDYYYNYICKDYALNFCLFVKDNYELQEVIGNDFKYTVFKKKD
jgi:hypothetical protein